MNEVTQIMGDIEAGDETAVDRLLPLLYDELRRLAAQQLAHEKPGQSLNATALVHEAYFKLLGEQKFESRRHFFGAAAQAMRRILVDRARARQSLKAGVGHTRVDLESGLAVASERSEELLEIDAALTRLTSVDAQAAQLVQLRYFGGCTMNEAAELLDISLRSAHRLWAYAKAWLLKELQSE